MSFQSQREFLFVNWQWLFFSELLSPKALVGVIVIEMQMNRFSRSDLRNGAPQHGLKAAAHGAADPTGTCWKLGQLPLYPLKLQGVPVWPERLVLDW